MKWVGMKGEGKIAFKLKSRIKWVGLLGLVLSTFSIFTHFLLARCTDWGVSEYKSSVTIFSWRPIFENADLSTNNPLYRRLWGTVKLLEPFHPYANPSRNYAAPVDETNGFIFVRIRGGFHEIRNSICDAVVVSRLLNATLVVPEIQSTTSSKGISFIFLFLENYRVRKLEAVFALLITTMALSFAWMFADTKPSTKELTIGLLLPRLSSKTIHKAVGVVGWYRQERLIEKRKGRFKRLPITTPLSPPSQSLSLSVLICLSLQFNF